VRGFLFGKRDELSEPAAVEFLGFVEFFGFVILSLIII